MSLLSDEESPLVIGDSAVDSRIDDSVQFHAERMQRQLRICLMCQNQFRRLAIGRFNGRLQRAERENARLDHWKPPEDSGQRV